MHHSLGNLDNFATSHIYGYQKKNKSHELHGSR